MYPHLYLYIVIVNCISSSSFAYHPHSHIDFTINIYSLINNHYYHFYTSSSTFICIVQYIHIHPNLYIITILLYIFIIILFHHHLGTIFSKSLLKTIYHHVTQSSSRLRKIHQKIVIVRPRSFVVRCFVAAFCQRRVVLLCFAICRRWVVLYFVVCHLSKTCCLMFCC